MYREQFTATPVKRPGYETNDCTVTSFAYAMRCSYKKAHTFMKNAGRKNRKGVSMYQALTKQEDIIKSEFKKELEPIKFWWDQSKGLRRRPTLRKLVNELGPEMHIVTIRGHALVIYKNKIVDRYLSEPGCLSVHIWKVNDLE